MAVWITEYAGAAFVGGHAWNPSVPMDLGAPSTSATNTTVLSSGQASTMFLLPTTRLIHIACSANAWILCSNSTSSTGTLATSTNAPPTWANTYEIRGVLPGSRLTCLST